MAPPNGHAMPAFEPATGNVPPLPWDPTAAPPPCLAADRRRPGPVDRRPALHPAVPDQPRDDRRWRARCQARPCRNRPARTAPQRYSRRRTSGSIGGNHGLKFTAASARVEVLNEASLKRSAAGIGRRVPADPARLHAARQDHRWRPPRRRAAAHRWRAGHRQDHDGAPDGPQHRAWAARPACSTSASSMTRSTCSTASSPWSRRSPAPCRRRKTRRVKLQDVRKEILGTWLAQGGDGSRRPARRTRGCGRRSSASPATARTCSCCAARRRTNTVENLRALVEALQGAVRRPAAGRLRRLHAEGAGHPGAADTETEKVTTVVNGLKDVALAMSVRDDLASSPPTRKA